MHPVSDNSSYLTFCSLSSAMGHATCFQNEIKDTRMENVPFKTVSWYGFLYFCMFKCIPFLLVCYTAVPHLFTHWIYCRQTYRHNKWHRSILQQMLTDTLFWWNRICLKSERKKVDAVFRHPVLFFCHPGDCMCCFFCFVLLSMPTFLQLCFFVDSMCLEMSLEILLKF